MIAFIVPLQSPDASKNWNRVSDLAVRCIQSLLNQLDTDFKVFLICNHPPKIAPHPNLDIIRRNYPVPDANSRARMQDKWQKVRVGLVAARALAPCHVMVVDADDLVSNRLAGYVNSFPQSAGWYLDNGYLHDDGSRFVYHRRHDFNTICGTSSVVRAEIRDFPATETGDCDESFILEWGHSIIHERMAQRGTPLKPLPFAGAVYILGTGENDSGFSLRGWRSKKVFLKKLLNYRLITRRLRSEFGLSEPPETCGDFPCKNSII